MFHAALQHIHQCRSEVMLNKCRFFKKPSFIVFISSPKHEVLNVPTVCMASWDMRNFERVTIQEATFWLNVLTMSFCYHFCPSFVVRRRHSSRGHIYMPKLHEMWWEHMSQQYPNYILGELKTALVRSKARHYAYYRTRVLTL